MSVVPLARLALLAFVTLLVFWVPGTTVFAQTAPADLPPEKARQFIDLLSDPDVKAWLERKIPGPAEEPPAAPLADVISNWEAAVRARLAALADAIPRIPQELSNAAGVVSRDVNSGRPGLVIGILAILIVVGFRAEWLIRRALARV
jgi:moderate conductance mechanosensitive channel